MNPTAVSEHKTFLYKLLLVLIFFNVWFPKAGIKLSGVPITVSNLIFFVIFIIWIISKFKNKIVISKSMTISVLLSIVYFLLKYILIYYKTNNIVEYVTYIIPLIVYPLVFIIVFDQVDSKEKISDIVKVIYYGFLMICVYSIIQFIFGIEKTAIPGLTVNFTDYNTMGSTWFMQKANGVDIANAKIVSTYQNGNLLGINLLLIYPLIYIFLKKENKNKQLFFSLILFIVCGFLSLSRTCWLGIILFIFLGIIFENEKNKFSIVRKLLLILFCILSMIFVFSWMPSVANRLLNTSSSDWINMSGRTAGLTRVLSTVNGSNSILAYIFGPEGIINYSGLAYEMFPLSVFAQTGIVGLILLYSIFFKYVLFTKSNNPISKGIKLALIIWLIIGCIECGYWLPPTAMSLFTLLAIGCASSKLNMEGDKK